MQNISDAFNTQTEYDKYVDQQTGNISLRGNENVRVLVDGKPTNISTAQFLKQIPSTSIKNIEFIERGKQIKKINNPNYNCHFVCSLSLCWPDNYDVTVSGRVDGKFSWPPKGNKGFGYDPIFRPLDYKLTFAEMVPNFKHNISHRSIAFNKLIKLSFPTLNS